MKIQIHTENRTDANGSIRLNLYQSVCILIK